MTEAVPNDISGRGQYHFGLLKKPTNAASGADITKNGFQESGINEGLFFGGIFMEDDENCDTNVYQKTRSVEWRGSVRLRRNSEDGLI